ncbi:hypothetical protein [endosymbiont GvMRE of Glomus versiforme]|uniref:hypothetical protein n=1 Tax=endosymbiont GvMRE of Glomus versiforme TaxID=2039283 RepID=UPI000ED8C172|nr:hypothetical protein [endosymbiont GvMRE of Glomus versiforme]RHZ37646.1 hypothetical protein GvMRE_I1g518 [endosymbiont GvMRE of Glomus versiforme]
MAGIDGKVKQFSDNILTLKDIRTRPALWYKPTDISPSTGKNTYIDLRIYYEWPNWINDYYFLPLPGLWQKSREQVCQDLLKKDNLVKSDGTEKIKKQRKELTEAQNTDKYPQVNYYLLKATNDSITVVFQNWKGHYLTRPDTVLFWGRNDGSGKAGKQIPNLYWIDNVDIIDPTKGYVLVKATLDKIWRDYSKYCESWGTAIIKKSTIGFYNPKAKIKGFQHNDHEDDRQDGRYEKRSGDSERRDPSNRPPVTPPRLTGHIPTPRQIKFLSVNAVASSYGEEFTCLNIGDDSLTVRKQFNLPNNFYITEDLYKKIKKHNSKDSGFFYVLTEADRKEIKET